MPTTKFAILDRRPVTAVASSWGSRCVLWGKLTGGEIKTHSITTTWLRLEYRQDPN